MSARRPRNRTRNRPFPCQLERLEKRLALSAASPLEEAAFAPGKVLVKLREPAGPQLFFAAGAGSLSTTPPGVPGSITSLLGAYGVGPGSKVFPTAPSSFGISAQAASIDDPTSPASVGLDRWFSFEVPADADLDEILASLRNDSAVEIAEPDILFRMAGD